MGVSEDKYRRLQKKKKFAPKRIQKVREETKKFFDADYIREV